SKLALGAAAALLLGWSTLTWRQTEIWRDSGTLWGYILTVDPESSNAEVGLANWYLKHDDLDAGIAHYSRAVELDSTYADGFNNLGVALARAGRYEEAVSQYARSLKLRPGNAEAHNNWGVALAHLGQPALA